MTAVMPQRDALEFPEPVVLTAQEYEALPPNNRMELVDGVVTLTTPATRRHQIVVQKLRAALESVCPEDLRIVWEQEVRLAPLLRRNPDLMAIRCSPVHADRAVHARRHAEPARPALGVGRGRRPRALSCAEAPAGAGAVREGPGRSRGLRRSLARCRLGDLHQELDVRPGLLEPVEQKVQRLL